jgi:hypothetical protein
MISLIGALFVTWYSGTIGALFAEYMIRGGLRTYMDGGYVGVHVEGVMMWGTIYAFVLLPFTTPFARFLIGIFYEWMRALGLAVGKTKGS